ncbi:MAG: hypothetical protein L6Q47_06390 [Ignavibacteriaceae bacterium]|nr:hypothetical protein [Ignavibacteriaceae bacterium]
MNEELLIQLLEPLQREKFIQGIESINPEEKLEVLLKLKSAFQKDLHDKYTWLEPGFIAGKENILKMALMEWIKKRGLTLYPKRRSEEWHSLSKALPEVKLYYEKIIIPLIDSYLTDLSNTQGDQKELLIKQNASNKTETIIPLLWEGKKTDLYFILHLLVSYGYLKDDRKNFANHFSWKDRPVSEKELSEGISKIANPGSSDSKGSKKMAQLKTEFDQREFPDLD